MQENELGQQLKVVDHETGRARKRNEHLMAVNQKLETELKDVRGQLDSRIAVGEHRADQAVKQLW